MTILFSGGCKNGKSSLAEDCAVALAGSAPLYYIATMIPHDEEDRLRIRRHIASRDGKGFITLEQGTDLCACLERADAGGTFLLDSVTAILSNEMFSGGIDPDAGERTARDLERFARLVKNAVFVSDFIYSDDGRYDEFTEGYLRALALCDRTLARVCDAVADISLGCATMYKGALPV